MNAPVRLFSILVPVYNEEATVRAVVDRLRELAFAVPHEIVVVNDGSTDGTRQALDAIPGHASLRVFHAGQNGGKGRAIRFGLQQARGDVVAIQDADLELDPSQLNALIAPILAGTTDVVYGSRFMEPTNAAPRRTMVANAFLTRLTNLLYGSALTDMETCYKVMRTEIALSLALTADRFDIEPEITAKLLRARHAILELPVRFEPRSRAAGKKIGWRDGIQAIQCLLRHRFTA
ncbi:MAG: glycosyltransferase family 2 protein [Vicinamibacterales bacterium]